MRSRPTCTEHDAICPLSIAVPTTATFTCAGYKEEGTTTTPFDMVVLDDLDRFHLVADVIDRVPKLGCVAASVKQKMRDKLIEHREYIVEHGEDMPEIKGWTWPY